MKRRLFLAVLSAVVVIAMSTRIGGCHAAPISGAAFSLSSPRTSALIKVQTACGWTYSCTNLGSGGNGPQQVQIYGPVNIYTGADVKPEIWRVPEGAWPWSWSPGKPAMAGLGLRRPPVRRKMRSRLLVQPHSERLLRARVQCLPRACYVSAHWRRSQTVRLSKPAGRGLWLRLAGRL